jgi:hypothetical protein
LTFSALGPFGPRPSFPGTPGTFRSHQFSGSPWGVKVRFISDRDRAPDNRRSRGGFPPDHGWDKRLRGCYNDGNAPEPCRWKSLTVETLDPIRWNARSREMSTSATAATSPVRARGSVVIALRIIFARGSCRRAVSPTPPSEPTTGRSRISRDWSVRTRSDRPPRDAAKACPEWPPVSKEMPCRRPVPPVPPGPRGISASPAAQRRKIQ